MISRLAPYNRGVQLTPGRRAQLAREKADHPTSRTRSEVQVLLGLSESTMDRYVRSGIIPPPAYHSVSGWPLWSAEQVQDLIKRKAQKGRLR